VNRPAQPLPRITTRTRTNLTGILKGDGANVGTVTVGSNLTYDGTTLAASNQTTAPGGSSGQIQYNSGGAFAGAAALTYATTGTHLTVTAQGGTVVPLAAVGATGQTAALFETRVTSGNATARFLPSGQLLLKSPSYDGTRIGTVLRYERDGSNGCDIFGDTVNSFEFNPSGQIFTVGASQMVGNTFFNRGDASSPASWLVFNAGTLKDVLTFSQVATPGAAPTGHYHAWKANTSAGAGVVVARSGAILTDISTAWRGGYEILVSDSAGANRTAFRAQTDGSNPLTAVNGATPVARQLLATGAGHTVDDVITVLQNFGIARQS
jgi:hypothetical protein